jgi:hypothetical protein
MASPAKVPARAGFSFLVQDPAPERGSGDRAVVVASRGTYRRPLLGAPLTQRSLCEVVRVPARPRSADRGRSEARYPNGAAEPESSTGSSTEPHESRALVIQPRALEVLRGLGIAQTLLPTLISSGLSLIAPAYGLVLLWRQREVARGMAFVLSAGVLVVLLEREIVPLAVGLTPRSPPPASPFTRRCRCFAGPISPRLRPRWVPGS